MAQTALLVLLAVLFFAVLVFLSQWIDSGSRAHSSTQLAYRGIKKTVINTFPVVNYSAKLKVPGLDTECLICLSEFEAGESVRILPKCNHGFHVHCIDKWLSLRSYCPKCRHCLIGTC